jgi:hypothetical protein
MGREGVKHPCGSLSCLAVTEFVPHDNCGMWSSNALSYWSSLSMATVQKV